MTATHGLDRAASRHRPHHVRAWTNAKFFESMDWYAHRRIGSRKAQLFADLPDAVVEIGAGSGASMRYLRPGTSLVAIEPNPYSHAALRRAADRHVIDLEIRAESAEAMGIATGSVDAVISTLTLCTVDDPERVLAEIRRILRPGGRLVFLEHVHAPKGPLRMLQRALRTPWHFVFDGCRLDRDTAATIAAAGFADVHVERSRFGGAFVPIWPVISGIAVA